MGIIYTVGCMPGIVTIADADPFARGNFRASVVGGSGRAFDDTYFILGLGAGYYLIDGLEVGLDGEAWFGGDPDIYKISPALRYVLPLDAMLRPYVGGFYRHTFIQGLDDLDSLGARGGVYFVTGSNWFFGVGVVYESYLNCSESTYSSCDDVYPEITFSISF